MEHGRDSRSSPDLSGDLIQRRVFVSGRVQGVGFRQSTRFQADQFAGLSGFVRNLPDGRVEAVFCGQPKDVLAMVAWCGKGPGSARVTAIEVREEAPDLTLRSFRIE